MSGAVKRITKVDRLTTLWCCNETSSLLRRNMRSCDSTPSRECMFTFPQNQISTNGRSILLDLKTHPMQFVSFQSLTFLSIAPPELVTPTFFQINNLQISRAATSFCLSLCPAITHLSLRHSIFKRKYITQM